MKIHPTAIVDPGARLGRGVEVGPHAYIGPDVTVGEGCSIGHGCHIEGRTTLGSNNILMPYVVLGTPPQDLTYHGQRTELVIGDDNLFREFVTVNIATDKHHGVTRIGSRNHFMIGCHIGHDCVIEDDVQLTNHVLLGGHCHIESGARLMGSAAFHQYVTVGTQAFVGGLSRIVQDVPPFMIVDGHPARCRGVNEIGLRRAGYSEEVIAALWTAYKAIYRTRKLNRTEVYRQLAADPDKCPEVAYLVEFLRRSQSGPYGRHLQGRPRESAAKTPETGEGP